jgi:hypothetical protein
MPNCQRTRLGARDQEDGGEGNYPQRSQRDAEEEDQRERGKIGRN